MKKFLLALIMLFSALHAYAYNNYYWPQYNNYPQYGNRMLKPVALTADKAPKDGWRTIRVYPEYRNVGAIILKSQNNNVKIKGFTIFYEGGHVQHVRNFTGKLREGRSVHQILDGYSTISEIVYEIRSSNLIGRRGKLELSLRYMEY
jgi:hypothetical protein